MIIHATHYTEKEGGNWIPIPLDPAKQISIALLNEVPTAESARINYVWCLDKWETQYISAIKFDSGHIYDFEIAKKYPLENPWWELKSLENSEKQSALATQEGGSHYKDFVIQPIEYITKNSIPYPEGNVIKYVSRHSKKNGIEDIKKAIHYLKLIAELQYGVKL